MGYFKEYYTILKNLVTKINEDLSSSSEEETTESTEVDSCTIASMINFRKEVEQLMAVATNNIKIESKSSLMTMPTPGWVDPKKENEDDNENP